MDFTSPKLQIGGAIHKIHANNCIGRIGIAILQLCHYRSEKAILHVKESS